MSDVRIDPEFRDLLPASTPQQYEELKKLIQRDGLRDPITVMGDVILDGHTRHRICEELGIEAKFQQAPDYPRQSREHAKIWIYENQLDRRNLDEDQLNKAIVDYYHLIKVVERAGVGGRPPSETQVGNQPELGESKPTLTARERTAETFGVKPNKVSREVAKDDAVNAVAETDPAAAETFKPTEDQARAINRAARTGDPAAVKQAFAEAKKPKAKPKPPKQSYAEQKERMMRPQSPERREAARLGDVLKHVRIGLGHVEMVCFKASPEEMAAWIRANPECFDEQNRESLAWLTRLLTALETAVEQGQDNETVVH